MFSSISFTTIKWISNLIISIFYFLFYSIILYLYNSNPIEISCFTFTILSKCFLLYCYKLKQNDSYLLKRNKVKILFSIIQLFIIIFTSSLIYSKYAFNNISLSFHEVLIYFILQALSSILDLTCLITLFNNYDWNRPFISQV